MCKDDYIRGLKSDVNINACLTARPVNLGRLLVSADMIDHISYIYVAMIIPRYPNLSAKSNKEYSHLLNHSFLTWLRMHYDIGHDLEGLRWWRHQLKTLSALLAICEGIPLTKVSNAELWCFIWSASELTAQLTIETLVIWDAISLTMTSL